jgi:AraC family transcriptional regulator of adaptative response / DNA-3-methyladenine glycosylase II
MDHDACYRALSTRDARFDGRLFVGVNTTGIYCRPICPARTPKREHVCFFPTAAAAGEAGFRPCLRCRPESSPDLALWRGTSNTVSRALTLIEAGALNEGSVANLADRLGVGERQLRRLFKQYLGASPVSVAQTRRVHLAKQLIHETELSMASIAMAAGFGSVRRFNETFQQLFRRPPIELRRTRNARVENDGVVIRLPYRAPYDFDAMLNFLRTRAIAGIEVATETQYMRSVDIQGSTGTIAVRHGKGDHLEAIIRIGDIRRLAEIIRRIRRVFDLSLEPNAVRSHLSEDKILRPLVLARPGLRVPGAWDGFELAIRAVLGQQITVAAATGLAGKLVHAYGADLKDDAAAEHGLTHCFPRPGDLAKAGLAALGMPRNRAACLSRLAQAILDDPEILGVKRSLDEAIAQLRQLAGIGEWTAQYVAMREMREPDAFPAADIGLLRAISNLTGSAWTPAALLRRAETWRPWRAYAALHLWVSTNERSLDASRRAA